MHIYMLKPKTQVLLVQLGSPKSPSVNDVRIYLKKFLKDRRVIDLPRWFWIPILYGWVLIFRPFSSAKKYMRIWDTNGKIFPLVKWTQNLVQKISKNLSKNILIEDAYVLENKSIPDVIKRWEKKSIDDRENFWLIFPQFPQYSESTIASVYDQISKGFEHSSLIPQIKFINQFHLFKSFIDLSAKKINQEILNFNPDLVILSFHGLPVRQIISKNDPYFHQCFETFYYLKSNIKFNQEKIIQCFQSRFGSEPWLSPDTSIVAKEAVQNGIKKILVYCPSFTVDCLETTDEIGHELNEEISALGGELRLVNCLNDDDDWAKSLTLFIENHCSSNIVEQDENIYYPTLKYLEKKEEEILMLSQKSSKPLSDDSKKVIKIVFLTLFLDLIGFSIIFPMFPAMAKHYLEVDSDNIFLKAIFGTVTSLTDFSGMKMNNANIVLFGGILGALYSFLQFLAAPIWGTISDRIGRKPVLLVSVFGLTLSYLLWFFSGSFTLLLLARFVGGIMGGNLSTASAVVADVTDKENRSKGMAFIGIAFALGFILGPAIGGALTLVDLTKIFPDFTSFGLNPFSMPALFAFVLSGINFVSILVNFKETLPPEKRGKGTVERSANLLKLFKPLPYNGVNLTNLSHFIFLTAFSGMEFTLTFLAAERLGYGPMDNAYMFVFIGFIIAFVQGGYVRRKANVVGENKMAIYGFISVIPGLIFIAFAAKAWMLYAGLFFLAVGSAMIIPCQTSAVSLYSPSNVQGHVLGIFRSLGSLARVIGPIVASLIYWKLGGAFPYLIGTFILIIPILMVRKLPPFPKFD